MNNFAAPVRRKWDEAWLTGASTWIDRAVTNLGAAVDGPVEQRHERPWSTVLYVPTTSGPLWFKANGTSAVHEAGVLTAMHQLVPGRVPLPVASDEDTGWFLMNHAGTAMTASPTLEADLARWEATLRDYARLQCDLSFHSAELVRAGTPDLRPCSVPASFDELLDAPEDLWVDQPGGLTGAEFEGLRSLRNTIRDWCDELDQIGIADTMQHDDLHSGNIFRNGSGQHIFIDWADACVSQPFGSLLHPERELMDRWGLDPEGPELSHLRSAYFEPWSDVFDAATLHRARQLALLMTCVVRALAWRRALEGVERAALKEYYARPEPRWLRKLLQADPLS
ncbi:MULTISPECIES: phosphotransferase family protein [Streptomyces]|uniref:phosphotransferase family protein n=1 Tax=Streptomyces TaxID=1883 RepID=UPI000938AD2C|nr:phosphotransferase [Streptomyces sp. CB02115]OKJ53363.1 hypothetical protein AMK28_24300 [Streptomyces sp. CB02115]WST89015.1 aminoglycoside phosphotransferase family protein [Streptomyces anulatus]WSU32602.1 aminoglycoside phosphotransferase family protein [Streptomyces anulatus]WSU88547.1 aminoglycoside phosphotransferase family protein [Streptomyces anulatus]